MLATDARVLCDFPSRPSIHGREPPFPSRAVSGESVER